MTRSTRLAPFTLSLLLLAACATDSTGPAPSVRADDQARAGWSDWSAPVNAGPVVNSPFVDLSPELSKDGLSLYFGSNRPGGVGANDIWVASRASVDAPWEAPVNLAQLNSPASENGAHVSRDGHLLYFTSARAGGLGGNDLYVSWREDVHDPLAWGAPQSLGTPINSATSDLAGSIAGEQFYFWRADPPGNLTNAEIWMSVMTDGTFGEPVLVQALSGAANDMKPSVRFDGREIVFGSDRGGNFDLWYSTRDGADQEWSVPQPVAALNTLASENRPSISPDGTVLLFDSLRPGGTGANDIYMATRRRGGP
jgi:hypothetical protein